MKSALLISGINSVTKEWTKQRKSEIRNANTRLRRSTMWKPRRISIKEVCWNYMERAYLRASGGGVYPATARQVMYAIRRQVQDMTGQRLDDQYFTQTLLPDYIAATGADWDVVYDDRGHLQEPHQGGPVIGLGTLSVRSYISYIKEGHNLMTFSLKHFPEMVTVKGPGYRFGAILFIEKEGFLPLLDTAGFAERYDLAIMSTKGVANTSARRLVDTLCAQYQIPLLVLRDFDRAGFIIASTLQRDTRRYAFQNQIKVVDLGLRLEDAQRYNLESEAVYEKIGLYKLSAQLRENGATEDEIQFLLQGQRVELNAFASDQFVTWLTRKLDELQLEGVISKVVPDADTLEKVYRAHVARTYFEEQGGELADQAWEEAAQARVPDDLIDRVRQSLSGAPMTPWYMAVQHLASTQADQPAALGDSGPDGE
jgi:hypothetical protein